MLYHLAGIDYRDDPYWLAPLADCEAAHNLDKDHFREPVKRMMQALINGREGKRNERIRMPNKQTFRPYFSRIDVAEMLKVKHARIADAFFSEAGIKLQRLESDIALTIFSNLKARGVACLPIHDSFVVEDGRKDELQYQMISVYKGRIGYDPVIKDGQTSITIYKILHLMEPINYRASLHISSYRSLPTVSGTGRESITG